MEEKEIIFKSKSEPTLTVQVIGGEFSLLTYGDDSEFYTDNSTFAFEVYKLLKKADEIGGFNHLKENEQEEELDQWETEARERGAKIIEVD